MSAKNCCPTCHESPRKRRSIFGMIFQILALYAVLVFSGGTLIQSGHPVAEEVGQLMHTVLLVEPATYWTAEHGMRPVSHAINFLSRGVDVARYT